MFFLYLHVGKGVCMLKVLVVYGNTRNCMYVCVRVYDVCVQIGYVLVYIKCVCVCLCACVGCACWYGYLLDVCANLRSIYM